MKKEYLFSKPAWSACQRIDYSGLHIKASGWGLAGTEWVGKGGGEIIAIKEFLERITIMKKWLLKTALRPWLNKQNG